MSRKLKNELTLHRVNNLLLALIILLCLYVIIAPTVPAVIFWWQKDHTNRGPELSQLVREPQKSDVPAQNTLVVPSMMLKTPIYEGSIADEYQTLDKGVWRWPRGSTPDKGGNTILIGHRFTYTNPRGIFYELNQVKLGDQLAIFWSGKEYTYKVSTITVVPPSDTQILWQTKQAEVTLYTCTPTWNPINRLVVVADLTSTRKVGA